MKRFLSNIIPRLSAYSKELDISEILIDKPWNWIVDEAQYQKLVFRRDGILLMIQDGIVKEGKWEIILPLKSILIDRNIDKLLFNFQFVNESVLLLKLDGSSKDIIPFINESNLPSLDYIEYLQRLIGLSKEEVKNLGNPYEMIKTELAKVKKAEKVCLELISSGKKFNAYVFVNWVSNQSQADILNCLRGSNTIVYFKANQIPDGVYSLFDLDERKAYVGISGKETVRIVNGFVFE